MKSKKHILFLLCTILLLSACSQNSISKQELQHINDYISRVHAVMGNHAEKVQKLQEIEDLYQLQKESHEGLTKLKTRYSEFSDEHSLQKVIDVYEFAFGRIYIRNQQIFELGEPLWKATPQTLEDIKDYEKYVIHQTKLDDLHSLLTEFTELILEHHELSRKKLVESGLDIELRKNIWPQLNIVISTYLSYQKPHTRYLQKVVANEIEAINWLHNIKEHYKVDDKGQLEFDSTSLYFEYLRKVRSANFDLNQVLQWNKITGG